VATASNTGGGDAPANALDGNPATRFSTGTPMVNGMWFQVDMLAQQSFNQITMDSGGSKNDYARGFEVYVSNDGVNFGSAVATGTGSSPLITVSFAPQTARYVKIVQTGAATFWWSIAELNVYAPGSTPEAGPPPEVALSRTGWTATASNTGGGDVPAHALDGNPATRFTTGTPMANGMWFQVDMRAQQSFNQITMDSGGSKNDYARGFEVYVSTDGVNFGNPVATGAGSSPLITVSFALQTARYVKIVQTGAATFWWSIAELNVYQP
jgi:beta-glucosidase